jgi:hypothetical protein
MCPDCKTLCKSQKWADGLYRITCLECTATWEAVQSHGEDLNDSNSPEKI